jgi:uncharacterized protein (DUF885 family)
LCGPCSVHRIMAPSDPLTTLEREIVDHLFLLVPGTAVGLGLHEYDGRLPDLSPAATERWASAADALLARLEAADAESLPPERKVDRFLLRLLLESPLFDLRVSHDLEQNPMVYVGSPSLTSYLAREYAPAARRVEAIARVLTGFPALLEQGRRRLRGPLPRPFVGLALAMGEGLPAHFAEAEAFARTAGLGEHVADARRGAEAALGSFLGWLRAEELPRATPDFALGPERFGRLLFVREGIRTPVEEIRKAGAADLARNQARLGELARAEGRSVRELLARLGDDHPPADQLLATARSYIEETRAFVAAHDLATLPEPAVCRAEETPAFGRALTTASMSPPGPFDGQAADGVYFVTLVDPNWTPTQQEEWLRSMNRSLLRNITVHEVYPGHYLQFLHLRASTTSLTRKVYSSKSFVEGWAHYCEQLAIEAGLGAGEHDAEVGELQDALLRDCRLLSAIGLHTEGWSVERATELFQTEAHMDRLPAEREAIRGTFDPEYFCYTLGKLAILDARRRLLATRFGGSLRRFHDAVLGAGCPPIGLLEEIVAGAPT